MSVASAHDLGLVGVVLCLYCCSLLLQVFGVVPVVVLIIDDLIIGLTALFPRVNLRGLGQ